MQVRDVLADVVIAHVPVVRFDYRQKVTYLAVMLRRLMHAIQDPAMIDDRCEHVHLEIYCKCSATAAFPHQLMSDESLIVMMQHFECSVLQIAPWGISACLCCRDYYGNKRLELAGGLLSLLFEDLFKRMNADLRKQASRALSKQSRAEHFDWARHIDQSIITEGFEHAVSSGNWTIKRFRMDRKGITQASARTAGLHWSMMSEASVAICQSTLQCVLILAGAFATVLRSGDGDDDQNQLPV